LYNNIHDPQVVRKWRDRGWDGEETFDQVDIKTLRKAGKTYNIQRLLWIMKHCHGMTGTGKFRKKWKYRTTVKLQRCGHYEETAKHVNKCDQPAPVDHWDKSLKVVGAWLAKQHTCPGLVSLLFIRVVEWKARKRHQPIANMSS
jgi:hypothetical protein